MIGLPGVRGEDYFGGVIMSETERNTILLLNIFESDNKKLEELYKVLDGKRTDLLYIKSSAFQEFVKQLEITNESKDILINFLNSHSSIKISDALSKNKLKGFRSGHKYFFDIVYESIAEIGKNLDGYNNNHYSDGYNYDYWHDALFEQGTADYVDNEFHRRKKDAGLLITGSSLPKTSAHHINLVQEAFALGLFEVTIVFLRALIETAAFQYLHKRGQLSDLKNLSELDSYKARELVRRVKPEIKEYFDDAIAIINKAGAILHSKEIVEKVTEEYALSATKNSIAIIEKLHN